MSLWTHWSSLGVSSCLSRPDSFDCLSNISNSIAAFHSFSAVWFCCVGHLCWVLFNKPIQTRSCVDTLCQNVEARVCPCLKLGPVPQEVRRCRTAPIRFTVETRRTAETAWTEGPVCPADKLQLFVPQLLVLQMIYLFTERLSLSFESRWQIMNINKVITSSLSQLSCPEVLVSRGTPLDWNTGVLAQRQGGTTSAMTPEKQLLLPTNL